MDNCVFAKDDNLAWRRNHKSWSHWAGCLALSLQSMGEMRISIDIGWAMAIMATACAAVNPVRHVPHVRNAINA